MADYGTRATDEALVAMEKRIRSVYTEAQKDIEAKTKDFWERHKVKDAKYRQQVKDGKITKEDYQAWLRGQVFQGKQWDAKLQQVQSTLAQANKDALEILNGGRIQVFATNSNWSAYQMEHEAGINFGFDIYDADAVTRLLRDDPSLLPAKKLSVPKDKIWNKGNINRQISQGIIQGESLDKIAQRLANVTGTNKKAMMTNARTMMTGAQNAGRQESYQRAQKMGIKLQKEWLATLDGHTRATHAELDGQAVDVDKPFKVGGYTIAYPGDPHARPELVYGCRCTTVAKLLDYPTKNAQRYDNVTGKPIKDMTYKEWTRMKSGTSDAEKDLEPIPLRPVPTGTPKTLENLEKTQKKFMDKSGDRYSSLSAEQIDELEHNMKKVIDNNSYYMAFDASNLDSIYNSHFMSQAEAESIFGGLGDYDRLSAATRTKQTKTLFGGNTNKMDPSDYEKYGFLGNSNWEDTMDVSKNDVMRCPYGKTMVRFRKDRMDGRVTFITTDGGGAAKRKLAVAGSIREDRADICGINSGYESKFGGRVGNTVDKWYNTLHDMPEEGYKDVYSMVENTKWASQMDYFELQFHGELTIDDVESICFSNIDDIKKVSKDTLDGMRRRGISVQVMEGGKAVDYK